MKITFVYTNNVTYKATNVTHIDQTVDTIEYRRFTEQGSVVGVDIRSVPKDDLLYAVIKDDDGIVSIVPGIYSNFQIVPTGAAVTRQQNIDAEAARIEADRIAKAPERNAREAAKYEARRAARKAAYLGTEAAAPTTSSTLQHLVDVALTVTSTLSAAGFTDAEIDSLRRGKNGVNVALIRKLANAALQHERVLSQYGFSAAQVAELHSIVGTKADTAAEESVVRKLIRVALTVENELTNAGFTGTEIATLRAINATGIIKADDQEVITKLAGAALEYETSLSQYGFTGADVAELHTIVGADAQESVSALTKLVKAAREVEHLLVDNGFSTAEIEELRGNVPSSEVVVKLAKAALSYDLTDYDFTEDEVEEIRAVTVNTSTDATQAVVAKLVKTGVDVESTLRSFGFTENELAVLRNVNAQSGQVTATDRPAVQKLVTAAQGVASELEAYGFTAEEISTLRGIKAL